MNSERNRKYMPGMRSEGNMFIVLQSFILRIDNPVHKISMPPTIDISLIKDSDSISPKCVVKKYMEPCQAKSIGAAQITPIPYEAERTIEVTKSKVAFVIRKVLSSYNALIIGPTIDNVPMQ